MEEHLLKSVQIGVDKLWYVFADLQDNGIFAESSIVFLNIDNLHNCLFYVKICIVDPEALIPDQATIQQIIDL